MSFKSTSSDALNAKVQSALVTPASSSPTSFSFYSLLLRRPNAAAKLRTFHQRRLRQPKSFNKYLPEAPVSPPAMVSSSRRSSRSWPSEESVPRLFESDDSEAESEYTCGSESAEEDDEEDFVSRPQRRFLAW